MGFLDVLWLACKAKLLCIWESYGSIVTVIFSLTYKTQWKTISFNLALNKFQIMQKLKVHQRFIVSLRISFLFFFFRRLSLPTINHKTIFPLFICVERELNSWMEIVFSFNSWQTLSYTWWPQGRKAAELFKEAFCSWSCHSISQGVMKTGTNMEITEVPEHYILKMELFESIWNVWFFWFRPHG